MAQGANSAVARIYDKINEELSNFKVRHVYLSILTTENHRKYSELSAYKYSDTKKKKNELNAKEHGTAGHPKRRDIDVGALHFRSTTTEPSHVCFNCKLFTYSYECDVKWKLDLNSTKHEQNQKEKSSSCCICCRALTPNIS